MLLTPYLNPYPAMRAPLEAGRVMQAARRLKRAEADVASSVDQKVGPAAHGREREAKPEDRALGGGSDVARPTGFNRADAIYIRIQIEGAGEWLKTATQSA
jgi:hypothetical protein